MFLEELWLPHFSKLRFQNLLVTRFSLNRRQLINLCRCRKILQFWKKLNEWSLVMSFESCRLDEILECTLNASLQPICLFSNINKAIYIHWKHSLSLPQGYIFTVDSFRDITNSLWQENRWHRFLGWRMGRPLGLANKQKSINNFSASDRLPDRLAGRLTQNSIQFSRRYLRLTGHFV